MPQTSAIYVRSGNQHSIGVCRVWPTRAVGDKSATAPTRAVLSTRQGRRATRSGPVCTRFTGLLVAYRWFTPTAGRSSIKSPAAA